MGVRCAAAGALLLAWAAVRGERANIRQWRHATVAGALMIACTYGALAWAEQPSQVSSSASPAWPSSSPLDQPAR
jgi:hypothetical protein